MLNREQILQNVGGVRREQIDAFGGKVLVRELSAELLMSVGVQAQEGMGDASAMAAVFPQIVAACLVDEDMEPLLTIEDVARMPASAFDDIQAVALKALELSGLLAEGEAEKNG